MNLVLICITNHTLDLAAWRIPGKLIAQVAIVQTVSKAGCQEPVLMKLRGE